MPRRLLASVEPILDFPEDVFKSLSSVAECTDRQERYRKYALDRHRPTPVFPSDNIPYDGETPYMIVVDKARPDTARILADAGLFGSYVTDCYDLPPHEARRTIGASSHIIDELIYVRPKAVITLGGVPQD